MKRLLPFLFLCAFSFAKAQTDCSGAIVVCGNTDYTGLAAVGFGAQELNGHVSCSSAENNSIWLRLDISGGGTLTFTIKPTDDDISIDYDFFVFGPNVSCNNIGQSIRCSTTHPQSAGATTNWTGLSPLESDTSEGPGPNGNSFLKPLDVLAGQSYFLVIDRPVGFSDFNIQWGGTATFNDPPVIQLTSPDALDLVKCDTDGIDDGSTEFDLTENNTIVSNGNPGMMVTYHETQNDAITGNAFIPDPQHFENTSNPQVVFARLQNPLSDCADFVSFTVSIENVISISADPVSKCDDSDGDASDGIATFNLQQLSAELLPMQDLSQLTITYFPTQDDMDNGTGEITGTFRNTVPFEEHLFVKVSNSQGCQGEREVVLLINPLPAPKNVTLTQCDVSAAPDGITLFDLQQANDDYVAGDPDLSVVYYANVAHAQQGISPLQTFINTTNPQQLIAKVTDLSSGCSRLNVLTLRVSSKPSVNQIIRSCDDPERENGLTTTDLTQNGFVLLPGETVRYFLTADDALLEQNEILNPANFANTEPYQQTVFARIEGGNDCAAIHSLTIKVNPLPNILTEGTGDELVCLNSNEFITINGGLLEGSPSEFSYIWWRDTDSLLRNTYSIQVNQPATYRVAVINEFGCRKYRTIVVRASDAAMVDQIDVVDIATDDHTVTITLSANSIGDYEYALDGTGNYQDSTIFENVNGGLHTVFVRDKNGCGVTERLFTVLDAPLFFTPNADGANDRWKIEGSATALGSATMLEIFTRDGKLLMTTDPRNSDGWDGNYDGRPMPADDYWFVVYFANGLAEKGHFALKR